MEIKWGRFNNFVLILVHWNKILFENNVHRYSKFSRHFKNIASNFHDNKIVNLKKKRKVVLNISKFFINRKFMIL